MKRPTDKRRVIELCLGAALAVVLGIGAFSYAGSAGLLDQTGQAATQASSAMPIVEDAASDEQTAASTSDNAQSTETDAPEGESPAEDSSSEDTGVAEEPEAVSDTSLSETAEEQPADETAAGEAADSSLVAGTPASYVYSAAADEAAAEAQPEEELPAHEEQAVLLTVAEDTTLDDLNAMLEGVDFVSAEGVTEEDLSYGVAELTVAEDMSVPEAVARLEFVEGVEGAQPNYIYTLAEYVGNPAAFAGLLDDTAAVELAAQAAEEVAETTAAEESDGTSTEETATDDSTEASSSDAADESATDTSTEAVIDVSSEDTTDTADAAASNATDATTDATQDVAATSEATSDTSLSQVLQAAEDYSINDPNASSQWGLTSVKAYSAWSAVRCEGDVGIAIIDTGADLDHPDLAGNIVYSKNFYETSSTADDLNSHGSHVAGIASAIANNGVGVAGVSYNADLVILKASKDSGTDFDSSSITKAFNWVVQNKSTYNIRVINLSVGGKWTTTSSDDALRRAIRSAYNAGIITVCAAGNSSAATVPYSCYPGDYSYAMSVINLKKTDSSTYGVTRASGSNYNESASDIVKDISAPGTDIYSTVNTGGYANKNGTSMSTPLVSGIAALVYKADSSLNASAVMGILKSTATDLGDKQQYGYGEVNAFEAVSNASNATISGVDVVQVGSTASYTATSKTVSGRWRWSSSNTSVATIGQTSGTLTAVGTGTTTITAVDPPAGIKATMTVTVIDPSLSGNDIIFASLPSSSSSSDYFYYSYSVSGGSAFSWTYSVSDTSVATVSNASTGKIYGRAAGTVTVKATCTDNTSIVASKTITVLPYLTINGSATLTEGGSSYYYCTPTTSGIGVSWSLSSGSSYASYTTGSDSSRGNYARLTATKGGGTAVLKVTESYSGATSITRTVSVKIGGNISKASISGLGSYTYTGSAITPSPTVTYNGTTLTKGTDYTLSYSNNTNAGTATVTITGKGAYTGSKSATFTINKRSLSSASVSLSQTSYTYDGSAHTPSVTVTYGGSTVASSNYNVTYSNNTSVGTATVTVTGKGTNYTGSKSATFTISVERVTMYRLYNPNSGEHFYTANSSERDTLVSVGWTYEGVGWTAPATSSTPVYRLYSGTDHHYTSNASERAYLISVGWTDEGVGWYSDDAQGVPLYRQYNPNVNPSASRNNSGSHNYTTSKGENDYLVSIGWIEEGIGWYGLS